MCLLVWEFAQAGRAKALKVSVNDRLWTGARRVLAARRRDADRRTDPALPAASASAGQAELVISPFPALLGQKVVNLILDFYGNPFSHAACLAHVISMRFECA
jgi:hypothetical protein